MRLMNLHSPYNMSDIEFGVNTSHNAVSHLLGLIHNVFMTCHIPGFGNNTDWRRLRVALGRHGSSSSYGIPCSIEAPHPTAFLLHCDVNDCRRTPTRHDSVLLDSGRRLAGQDRQTRDGPPDSGLFGQANGVDNPSEDYASHRRNNRTR